MGGAEELRSSEPAEPGRPAGAPRRRPGAWALVAFVALSLALCLPPTAPGALFWGLVALATAGSVAWALSLASPEA